MSLLSIAVYAVYRAFNAFRFHPPKEDMEVEHALRQFCKTATYGHAPSAAVLQRAICGRFARRPSL
eukprot:7349087-Karenia_brevis.AAC.1